jgi:hypothetical protein
MKTQVSIPIETEQFLGLVDFLRSNGDARDPVMAIADALDYWMDNASWKPELLSKSVSHGYQWKSLFLPDRTEIRMQYKGAYFYASVESDELVYNGKPISPSTLANTIAGSSRNAWRDLWVKRPGDADWCLADELRPQK